MILGLGAAAPVARGPAAHRADPWLERSTHTMGTLLTVRVRVLERARALTATEAVFGAVARVDQLLSTWREDSEIARLNRQPVAEALEVSPQLAGFLIEALRLGEQTGWAFDPTIGALIDAWDLRGDGRIPGEAELALAHAATGARAFTVSEGEARRLRPGAWFETGAFGKGAALRAAAEALAAAAVRDALLNFGGQVLALGAPDDAEGWLVPVAHPRERDRAVARLRLRDLSAATSGQSERSLEVGGRHVGHVLDPRTGQPVPAWGSVTVVHADPLVADALATALLVMGAEAGHAWAESHGIAALFLVDSAGGITALHTSALAPILVAGPLPGR